MSYACAHFPLNSGFIFSPISLPPTPFHSRGAVKLFLILYSIYLLFQSTKTWCLAASSHEIVRARRHPSAAHDPEYQWHCRRYVRVNDIKKRGKFSDAVYACVICLLENPSGYVIPIPTTIYTHTRTYTPTNSYLNLFIHVLTFYYTLHPCPSESA